MWLLLALAPTAAAQQDVSVCKGGFSAQDLEIRLGSAETALATAELEVARRLLDKTRVQLPCLTQVVPARLLSEFAFQQALLSYADQDEDGALRWARLGRQAWPEWPGSVAEGHPLRELVEDAGPPSPAAGVGRVVPPKGGGLFVDGAFVDEVSGFVDVPAFLQVADVAGVVVETHWVEADAFPERWVGPPGSPPKPPRWWTEDGFDPTRARKAPEDRAPVVPIAATAGLAAVSGALYALSALSVGALDTATTEDELAGARSTTNALAIGSLAAGVGAIGAGVTVVLAADGGGAAFTFRFR